jgi:hypothetical protein
MKAVFEVMTTGYTEKIVIHGTRHDTWDLNGSLRIWDGDNTVFIAPKGEWKYLLVQYPDNEKDE